MYRKEELQKLYEEAKKECWKYRGQRGAYVIAHNIIWVKKAVALFLKLKSIN